jgi:hypothetical protein
MGVNSKVADVLGTDWTAWLANFINNSSMTEQEIQDLLDKLGLNAKITLRETTVSGTANAFMDANGDISGKTGSTTKLIGTINAEDIVYTGNGKLDPSAAEELEEIELDEIERYKEINDQLDILADKYDDAAKAADRLYGAARIRELENISDLISDEITALESKKGEIASYDDQGNLIKGYLFDDQQDLKEAMEATGY